MDDHVIDIACVTAFVLSMDAEISDDMRRFAVKSQILGRDHVAVMWVYKKIGTTEHPICFCFRVDDEGILRIWHNVEPKASRWKISHIRDALNKQSRKRPPLGSIVVGITDDVLRISATYALPLTNTFFCDDARHVLENLIANALTAMYRDAAEALAIAEKV